MEANVRNLAAHEIVSVTATSIRTLTGLTPEYIMKRIKLSFNYAGIAVRNEQWESYDQMNKQIIDRMKI